MANATITVLESDGVTETDVVVLDVGRQAAAASKSVAASTEDKAVLDAIAASLALLDNSIATGNELQVDVVGALPAGTNAIGKLAANSGVDIGDVDVTSIAAGDNVLGRVKITDGTNALVMVDAAVSANAFALPVAIHPDSVNANGQNTAANSAPVVLSDYGKTVVKSLTMSTDTSAYASGDLIADTQQLDAALRVADGTGVLQSLTIIDEDAQGVAFYVLVMRTSTSLGSENSAPNISDANLTAGLIGIIPVATTDYVTCSGAKIACIRNIGMPIKAVSGTDDIYIAVLNGSGTPTYTASGLEFVFGIQQD